MPVNRARPAVLSIVSGLLLVQCAGFFQGAGKAMVSDQDEMKLGAQFNNTLTTNDTAKKEFPIFVPHTQADADFQNYVQGLCRDILASIPKKELPSYNFTFTLIDKDVENAFAVPGGYVYIYTGIIKKLKDESELAGILGHEITHVRHHHFRESLARNEALGLSLEVLLGATQAGQIEQMAAGTFFQLAGLKFSRANEADADKGGTQTLGWFQHNPMGIAKYFARTKGAGVPEWLADHPGSKNRVKAVTQQVQSDPVLRALAADSARTNYEDRFRQHVGGWAPRPAASLD